MGYTATIIAVKKITSANCDSGRSYETVVDFEKVLNGKFQLYSNVIIIPRDGGHLKSNKPISRAMKHCDSGRNYPQHCLYLRPKSLSMFNELKGKLYRPTLSQ